jgi:hypothetical protein
VDPVVLVARKYRIVQNDESQPFMLGTGEKQRKAKAMEL